MSLLRRHFVQLAGTGLLLQSQLPQFLKAQSAPGVSALPGPATLGRSKVALIHSDDRRKNVHQALLAIDDESKYPPAEPEALRLLAPQRGLTATGEKQKQLQQQDLGPPPAAAKQKQLRVEYSRNSQSLTASPAEPGELPLRIRAGLQRKKYVVITPNNVSVTNQLAATNVDALNGILNYLELRFRGPVVITESSAEDTSVGFENFKYNQLTAERHFQKVSLVDLNREGKYVLSPVVDPNLHMIPVRLAARLFDPDAYVISSAMLKTHNIVVATLSVKNMVMGAPLHSAPGEIPWNDKRKVHPNFRETNSNMLLNALRLQPNWGVALIDGFEGMEGNGPSHGTPVPSHLAIASTDFVAADGVGLETMGINPDWVGYLTFDSPASSASASTTSRRSTL